MLEFFMIFAPQNTFFLEFCPLSAVFYACGLEVLILASGDVNPANVKSVRCAGLGLEF